MTAPDTQELEVIAQRLLTSTNGEYLILRIFRPTLHPSGRTWMCSVEVLGSEGLEHGLCAEGTDSLAALTAALAIAKTLVTRLAGDQFYWRSGDLGLGLDVPSRP